MKLVNLTPHTLNIFINDTTTCDVEPSGEIARVDVVYTPGGSFAGVPVQAAKYGDITGLPEAREGVIYVVSGLVEAATDRPDVFAPGPLVRDADGKPVGCKGLKYSSH